MVRCNTLNNCWGAKPSRLQRNNPILILSGASNPSQAETIGSMQEGYTRRSKLAHKQRDSGQRAGNSHSGVPSGLGKRFEFQALKICGLGGIRTGDDDILA